MEKCKDKRQIRFGFRIDPKLSEELKGKVVQDVAFCDSGEQHFTIVFTDGTYISIGLDYDDDNNDWKLCDNYISEPACINDGKLDSWIDNDGNLHFLKWCQELIRLGIWNVSEDEVKDIIRKKEAEQEKRDYEKYLQLKAKFEKHEENN